MTIYRGLAPLKAYKGDMQPVNVYRGSTKVAGWHAASYSGQSPLAVDCGYNVPPDALTVDGKCSQVQSCWGTNLVTNGDFSNGTTGWSKSRANFSIINGVAQVSATAKDGNIACFGLHTYENHAYYCSAIVMANTTLVQLKLELSVSPWSFFMNKFVSNTGSANRISFVTGKNLPDTYNVDLTVQDLRTSGWDTFTVDNVAMIDLTAAFGAGKEPTAAQMDAIMEQFTSSWFDGSAPFSPSPYFPAPISTITGDMTITGADGTASDTVTVAFGSAVCASLPDGTHDSYDAVTGVLTKRVGKFIGSYGTRWTISGAETDGTFMCDEIPAGKLSGRTLLATSACAPTVYYKLATPTTVKLTPHLPVVHTGIKTLSVGADVAPTISVTVKVMS